MAKIKIVHIAAVVTDEGYERWEYVDSRGRIWTHTQEIDNNRSEYDETGKRTKSVYKDVWEQLELPDEPEASTEIKER